MGCAFKCDRCGKYYDKTTLETGPRLFKNKNTTVLDLCEECKASLTNWLNQAVNGSCCEEYVEQFIKHRSFELRDDGLVSYITLAHFVEALEIYFSDCKWTDDPGMKNFIKGRTYIKDIGGDFWHDNQEIISTSTVKECLIHFLDYEWKDEFYG